MDKNNNTRITQAIKANDNSALKQILAEMRAKKLDINECMQAGQNYLELAYEARVSRPIYKTLLQEKIDPQARLMDQFEYPVLYRLMWDEETSLFKFFLENGADPNMIVSDNTAYELSLERCNEPTYGEFKDPEFPRSKPLLCALIECSGREPSIKPMIRTLLATPGLKLGLLDENADSAYAYAAAFGDERLLAQLEQIDPSITKVHNNNLLQAAINNERPGNVKYLIKKGIDVNGHSKTTKRDPLCVLLARYEDVFDENYFKYKQIAPNPKELPAPADMPHLAQAVETDPDNKNLIKILRLLLRAGARLDNTPETAQRWTEMCQFKNNFIVREARKIQKQLSQGAAEK